MIGLILNLRKYNPRVCLLSFEKSAVHFDFGWSRKEDTASAHQSLIFDARFIL